MKPITVLPLLITLFCTVAYNSGQCTRINDKKDFKANFHYTKFVISEPGIVKKSQADTIPESELSKIKDEDIESVNIIKNIITVRLKNGDSVIAKRQNYTEEAKKNHRQTMEKYLLNLKKKQLIPAAQVGG